jgi:hypothetical protein
MNCQEFEQRVWAEPKCAAPEFTAHREACPDCGRLAAEVLVFESEIDAGLAVEPPRGLARRIRRRRAAQFADDRLTPLQRLQEWLFGNPGWVGGYAAVATVLLVVGVLRGGLTGSDVDVMALEQLATEHFVEERFATKVSMEVPRADLALMFAEFGARLDGEIKGVTFANGCVMEKGIKGAHLVLDTPRGKVTVLVIPHRAVDSDRSMQVEGLPGRLTPYNNGTLALIGPDDKSMGMAEERMRNAVTWL